jgi:hypothetical protein
MFEFLLLQIKYPPGIASRIIGEYDRIKSQIGGEAVIFCAFQTANSGLEWVIQS